MSDPVRSGAASKSGDGIVRGMGGSKVCRACGRPLDERSIGEIAARREALSRLSESQRQVLGHLLLGLTEPQIAEKLHRSRHTVHDHTKAIYSACDVQRRVNLVRFFSGMDPADLMDGQVPAYLQ